MKKETKKNINDYKNYEVEGKKVKGGEGTFSWDDVFIH